MTERPLHLLRPLTGWRWQFGPRKGEEITDVEDALAWVDMIRKRGFGLFYTTTRRRPKRIIEAGSERYGSCFFCKSGVTMFRMPISGFDTDELETDIVMKPTAFRVRRKRVGLVRGWRYLEDADAPADDTRGDTDMPGDMPPEFYEVVGYG